MKLNDLAASKHLIVYGFQALKDYGKTSSHEGSNEVLSSLSPAVMAEMDIYRYYAPVMARGTTYNSAEQIRAADLDVIQVTVRPAEDPDTSHALIVSGHAGTVEILRDRYPDAEIYMGNATPEMIAGRCVIGTLPPMLIQHCAVYIAVTIDGYDRTLDDDLTGYALLQRMHVSPPITVTIA